MNCMQASNHELVGQYVAGQLAEPELTAFEEHYFHCDECLAAVQVGQAIQTADERGAKVMAMPARRQVSRWLYAAAAAVAGIALVLTGWRLGAGGAADGNASGGAGSEGSGTAGGGAGITAGGDGVERGVGDGFAVGLPGERVAWCG